MSTPQPFTADRDASTPCTELLEWLTDVPIARDGTDAARTQLRAYPRHTYSYDVALLSDHDKAALSALRTAETFLVPLWCHAFQRPATSPTAGVSVASPVVALLSSKSEGIFMPAADFSWEDGYYIAAPAAVGRMVSDNRSIAYAKKTIQTASVSFRLLDFKEAIDAYDGPTSGGLPTLDAFTTVWVKPSEQIDVASAVLETGHLDLFEVLYLKRNVTIEVPLRSREQIEAFRRLMFALKGRLNPLKWTVPGEAEKTWRLGSDGVEISYLKPNLATCKLSLVQLGA